VRRIFVALPAIGRGHHDSWMPDIPAGLTVAPAAPSSAAYLRVVPNWVTQMKAAADKAS
jgi:hypothetical protein